MPLSVWGGNQQPSIRGAVSTDSQPPHPYDTPLVPQYGSLEPHPYTSLAAILNFCDKTLQGTSSYTFPFFFSRLTWNERISKGMWVIDASWHSDHISWFMSSVPPKWMGTCFVLKWIKLLGSLVILIALQRVAWLTAAKDLCILCHPCTHPSTIPELPQRNQIHQQSLNFLRSC